MNDEYEYRGLMAATWDLFRGDTSRWRDRFFFQAIIEQHEPPILDVGCGTGRLLLDFLSQGYDIEGVDNSPEMLALCREKAQALGLEPTLYHQTMETLDLPRRYGTILVPSSSFQLLTEPEDANEAMRRFFAHLEPGGVLAMPFMLIWQEGEPVEQEEWKLTGEKVREEDGAVARRWSRARYDVEAQLEHTEDRYEVTVQDKVVASEHHRRSPATRWYTQAQARTLYEAAGFSDIQFFKEFSFEPASEGDAIFCVVGKRHRDRMEDRKEYLYRIQPTRPAMLSEGPTPEEQAIVSEHFAYLKQLTKEGVVLLAGRTLNTDVSSFGIVIFRAPDDETAQQVVQGDPAVQRGVMRAELFPYRIALIADQRT